MTPLFEEFFKTASEEERQQWISTNENLHNAVTKLNLNNQRLNVN